MSAAATSTGGAAAGWVRRGGLALVMVGALSVSVRGQVQAVEPLLGGMSVVLALTNDLAALLALNELMTTRRPEVRRWAWAVLLLAGGTAAGLNTWHAVAAGVLAPVWAVVVGIGPVLLAVLLSHLVALVLDAGPAAAAVSEHSSVGAATAAWPVEPTPAGAAATPTSAIESSRAGQVATEALTGPGSHHDGHHGLAVVPTQPDTDPAAAGRRAQQVHRTDRRVEQVAAQLRRGTDLTGAAVAAQLGCSERTGRRLLRQALDNRDDTITRAGTTPPTRSTTRAAGRERGTG
ncbi:MAG: hypothetical protein AB7V42_16695 [Thermoleophilia bacterium]